MVGREILRTQDLLSGKTPHGKQKKLFSLFSAETGHAQFCDYTGEKPITSILNGVQRKAIQHV